MSRPTVLHVAQPTDGGVAGYVVAAAADQLHRGWSVAVACPADGWLAGELADRGVPTLAWSARRAPGPASTAEVLRLRGIVAAVRPDVVHLHSSKAGLVGRLAVRGRLPTLFQPHGWSWLATRGSTAAATLNWERAAARWTDVLVCVGEGEAAEGRARGVRARYAVVRNGVDLRRFRPADGRERAAARELLGIPPSGPLVVCVGRVTRQKGQDLLLAAWPLVTARHPDAELALVGDGDLLPALRRRAPDRVRFVGAVADVRPWYVAADLVALPSRWEGLPFALLEALASGRSVVATAVAGLRDALPADAGALVPAGDTPALAAAIQARLSAPARLRAESRAAAEQAAGFDIRHTLRELAGVTESALAVVPLPARAGGRDLAPDRIVPAPRAVPAGDPVRRAVPGNGAVRGNGAAPHGGGAGALPAPAPRRRIEQ